MLRHGPRCLRVAGVSLALTAAIVVTTGAAGVPAVAHAERVTVSTSSSSIVAQKGDRSELVKQIQQKLIALGIPVSGGADGIYGTYTANAVAEFQRRKGLSQTGTVDTATAVALGVAPATPLLAKGSNGDAVKTLQQQLIAVGITPAGGADGIYGSGTETAVRQFQTAKGLPVTGQVDAATAGILANAAKGATPSTPPPAPAAPPLAQIGSRGSTVVTLQQDLLAVGITFSGGADGIYGSATSNALKAFQQRVGLSATGVYDGTTATKLTAAAAEARAANVVAKIGSRGTTVITLQKDLQAVGLGPYGGADGVYGAATANSVKQFQQRNGLPATGIYDKATAAKLTAAAADARNSPPTPNGNPSGTNSNGTVTLAVFPTSRRCTFIDSFGAPRSGGRSHAGVDIIAPRGTPVYAVQSTVIWKKSSSGVLSGNALWLAAADGTYFFYAHLDSFAPGISQGVSVRAGDLIGFVGSTGNAGIPHLHFEVHPRGGTAVNPYPIVKAVSGC